MKVGRSAVVPNLRWAAAMARMASGVGELLNKTSPPPLTCRSMNPGRTKPPRAAYEPRDLMVAPTEEARRR